MTHGRCQNYLVPGYDSEWTADEEESEEVVQSEPVDQVAEERGFTLRQRGARS